MANWNFGARVIDGKPSGFVIRIQDTDEVIAIIPKNPPRTQAECEAIARSIVVVHNIGEGLK